MPVRPIGPGLLAPGQPFAPKDVRPPVRVDEIFANEFGVAADGTDQTVNLGRAVSHAVDQGKPLVIPPGEYQVDDWTVDTAGATIRGFGSDTVIKRRTGAASARALTITAADVTISDLTLDGNVAGGGATGSGCLDIRGDNCSVSHVSVVDSLSIGIRIVNCGGVSVDNCRVLAPASAGITFSSSADEEGLWITNCVVDRRGITDVGRGIGLTAATTLISGITITGNTIFQETLTSGLCIELLSHEGRASDVVIANNRTHGGGMGVSVPEVFRCNVIGNYITGCASGIEIGTGEDTSCVGNTLIDCDASGIVAHSAIRAAIVGNVVRGCGHTGIGSSTNSSDILPEDVTVSGNVVEDCGVQGMEFRGNTGLTLPGVQSLAVSGNVVNNAPIGIVFRDVPHLTCTGNVVRNITGDGIRVGGAMATAVAGTVVGNDVSEAVGTPLDFTHLSGGATVTGVVRWANAGSIPSRAAFASTDALLIDAGVIVA